MIIKIFCFSILVIFIYFSKIIFQIIWLWLLIFVGVLFFNFVAFYPSIRFYFFRERTKYGEWYTTKYDIDKKFKVCGGIIGYQYIKEKHIAIIFPSDSSKNYPVIDSSEILPLLNYYKETNENYNVYFCYQTDDFIKIVKSPYVYGLHIFGHGRIDSLVFQDGIIQYREFKGIEPKEFVAQWHCNHGYNLNTSLGYFIGKKYYVPYGKRGGFQNKRDIKKLINNKLKWEVNKKFS